MREKGLAQIAHLFIGILVGVILIVAFLSLTSSTTPKPTTFNPSPSTITKSKEASPGAKIDQQKLQKYLTVEAALLGVSDNYSLYFRDLTSDQEITIDPTRSWIPASIIKAYVAMEAFRQRDLGLVNFDQVVTINSNNVVPTELETDDYPRLRDGTQATVKQLVEAMITQSDNSAYNTLLDVLDRRNINNSLKNIGLTETVVGEKLNLDEGQFQKDLTVAGRQPNTTTAKDLAAFFDLLYSKQIADSEEILTIFKKQKINNMIPALLPESTVVAHKTGDWAPIFHDGGVVYKEGDPFVLAIFTNSNTPSVLSQLAKVAYYQTAETIGQDIVPLKKSASSDYPSVFLAQDINNQTVLGEENQNQKFPQVTAEDLGITSNDLSLYDAQDAKKISSALITPQSWFYGLKRVFEGIKYNLPFIANQKVKNNLEQSNARLSELKTVLKSGGLEDSRRLLEESEKNLKDAVGEAKKGSSPDIDLTNIKQVNELHYAALADVAKTVDKKDKEKFVDVVYTFLQENKKEVKPVIAKSVIANPLQQKPLIGTVKEVDNQKAVVQFDDGSQKSLTVNDFTPVRDFHSDQIDTSNHLEVGSKLAVVGKTTSDDQIIPQFILKNIPRELPDKHEGTVVEIDPKDRILKIKEKDKTQTIQVDEKTVVKGSDTDVSLEGIKAGSKVTVFGEYQNATSSSSQAGNNQPTINPSSPAGKSSPSPKTSSLPQSKQSSLPQPKPSGTVGPALKPGLTPTTAPTNQNNQSNRQNNQPILKATTISVTKNSSGKNEVITKPTTPPPPPSQPKPAAPPPPPAPAPIKK